MNIKKILKNLLPWIEFNNDKDSIQLKKLYWDTYDINQIDYKNTIFYDLLPVNNTNTIILDNKNTSSSLANDDLNFLQIHQIPIIKDDLNKYFARNYQQIKKEYQ